MPEREILQRENFVVAVFSPAILKQFPPNLSCEGSLSFKVTTSTGSTAADFQEPQAFLEHTLEEMGRKFDVSVYIDVSDEQVVKRLSERRVCHQCRAEFHLLSDPFGTCPRKKCTGEFLRHLEEDQSRGTCCDRSGIDALPLIQRVRADAGSRLPEISLSAGCCAALLLPPGFPSVESGLEVLCLHGFRDIIVHASCQALLPIAINDIGGHGDDIGVLECLCCSGVCLALQ